MIKCEFCDRQFPETMTGLTEKASHEIAGHNTIKDSAYYDRKIADYIEDIIKIEEKRVAEYDYMETKITKNEYRNIVKALRHHSTQCNYCKDEQTTTQGKCQT